nr:hypothetical protein [Tanacetum cinerariifolium]
MPDGKTYFKCFNVCFKGLKQGWLEGRRRVIGLDGCFLKTICKGELLSAVGRDGNNQAYTLVRDLPSYQINTRDGRVIPSGGSKFEVRNGYEAFKVDEMNMTCSCRQWQLTGIPCAHGCVAIYFLHKDPDKYVSDWKGTIEKVANQVFEDGDNAGTQAANGGVGRTKYMVRKGGSSADRGLLEKEGDWSDWIQWQEQKDDIHVDIIKVEKIDVLCEPCKRQARDHSIDVEFKEALNKMRETTHTEAESSEPVTHVTIPAVTPANIVRTCNKFSELFHL